MTVIEKNSLILAPMAGVTDYVYRGLCARFGAEATVTEMVSAKGYLLTPKERLDVIQLRQTNPGEHCALQIFGSDADFMARAAERLCESRFFALDINMGCPAPKIVSGGDGSAMLKDLKNAEKVLRAVVKASSLPVTVKMRMGWDEQSICTLEALKMAQDCGVSDAARAHSAGNVCRSCALGRNRRAGRSIGHSGGGQRRYRERGGCAADAAGNRLSRRDDRPGGDG